MESPDLRRRTMQAVKSKDTAPEMAVRRLLHSMGFRYRLHRKDLPGCPDLVFPSRQKIIFVHGCFWHGHCCARGDRPPKAHANYWTAKIGRNRARDKEHLKRLNADGWDVLIVWECEIHAGNFKERLAQFLFKQKPPA
ncbi:MAG TPA: very short patch repair endonuclease [Bryobacteraceae bacterium]|nr:very short patch repair endonuclease [Bryobacteraceae bacterium]